MHNNCGNLTGNQPPTSTPMDMGAMMKAMAWKVKYRRTFQTAGNTVSYKTRISWDRLGVHKDNRGSLFPQVNTLKDLANAIFTMGFCLEEADHMGVSVETADGDVEPHQWNQQHVMGVDELQPCFPPEAVIDRLFLTHTLRCCRQSVQCCSALALGARNCGPRLVHGAVRCQREPKP